MSILQKKAQYGLDATANLPDAMAPWQAFHESIATFLTTQLGCDVITGSGMVESGDYKALVSEMPEEVVSFSFGLPEAPHMIVAAIAPDLVSAVTQSKLTRPGDRKRDTTSPASIGLLDLYLMRPFAKLFLEELTAQVMTAANQTDQDPLTDTGSELSLSNYTVDKKIREWVKLTLNLTIDDAPESGNTKTKKTKKSNAKNAKKTKTPETEFPLAVHLFLPKAIVESVTSAYRDGQSVTEYDPMAPWAIHMAEAAGYAEVPVKAVLETFDLNVAECTRLSIGQIIELPSVSLQSIRLETDTDDGPVELAVSALGTYKSNRALQLSEDISPAFISDMNTISQ